MLGSIKEIFAEYMVVALPDNIYGHVYSCDLNEFISQKVEEKLSSTNKVINILLINIL